MIDKVLAQFLAVLQKYFAIYFNNFRVGEFTVAMGLAYGTGVETAQRLGVSPALTPKIGALVAGISALTYIRNPKKSEWVTAATSVLNPTVPTAPDADQKGA